MNEPNVAIQVKCVHCGREQYGPAVMVISRGEHPCVWCGFTSRKMTEGEYREAHEARKAKK